MDALVSLEFVAGTTDDSEAMVVGELVARFAGSLDALVTSQGVAGRTGGQGACSMAPCVAFLAVLVARSFEEAESFWALGQNAVRVYEGESVFNFALGGNALSVFDSPALLASQSDTISVLELVAFCAGDLLADSVDEDETISAAIDGGDGSDRGDDGGAIGDGGAICAVGSVVVDSSPDADAIFQSPSFRALANDTLAVDELEPTAASDCDALSVFEFLVIVADDAVARTVWLESKALRTRGSDALVFFESEVLRAFSSGADPVDELEAILAVFVADSLNQLVVFWAADPDALALDELVVLVTGDRDAGVVHFVETWWAVFDHADTVDKFIVLRTEHLEALVVLHDRSSRTLDCQGFDALLINQGETFRAVSHGAGAIFKLESFFAGKPFTLKRCFVESEVLRVAAADGVALSLDKLLACWAGNSDADVLLLLLAKLQQETFGAGDFGADSSVEELSDCALFDARAIDKGKPRSTGVDDAGLEGKVILLVHRTADVGANSIVEEVARSALHGDTLLSDLLLTPGALDLEALLVFKNITRRAAGELALLGRQVECLAFAAL